VEAFVMLEDLAGSLGVQKVIPDDVPESFDHRDDRGDRLARDRPRAAHLSLRRGMWRAQVGDDRFDHVQRRDDRRGELLDGDGSQRGNVRGRECVPDLRRNETSLFSHESSDDVVEKWSLRLKDTPENCQAGGVDGHGVDVRLWESEANGHAEVSGSEYSEANDQKLVVDGQIFVTDVHAITIGLQPAEIDDHGAETRVCVSELHEANLDIDDEKLAMRL
jgi:hypothetical protein